jgi:hypothetical protein
MVVGAERNKKGNKRSSSRTRGGASKTIEQRGGRMKDLVNMNQLSYGSPTSLQIGNFKPSQPDQASQDMIRTFGNKSPMSTAYSSKQGMFGKKRHLKN